MKKLLLLAVIACLCCAHASAQNEDDLYRSPDKKMRDDRFSQTELSDRKIAVTRFKCFMIDSNVDLSKTETIPLSECKIGTIPADREVEILDIDRVRYIFYKIKYKNKIGYIHRNAIYDRSFIAEENPDVLPKYLNDIKQHTIREGMSETEVELSLGIPLNKYPNSNLYDYLYNCEKWYYGTGSQFNQVFFYNKILFGYYSDSWHFKKTFYVISPIKAECDKESGALSASVILDTESKSPKVVFEDERIKIDWVVSEKKFVFNLINKGKSSIKIPWDEIAYVDVESRSKRVIHQNVKFANKGESMPSSVIPKAASISDILIPSDNINYINNNWEEDYLFPRYCNQEHLEEENLKGKTFRILFPIIINDVRNEYTFEFKIEDIVLE